MSCSLNPNLLQSREPVCLWHRSSVERRRGQNGRTADIPTPRRTPRGGGGGGEGAPPLRGHTPRQRRSIADDAASDASDAFSDDDSSQYSAYTDRWCDVTFRDKAFLLKYRPRGARRPWAPVSRHAGIAGGRLSSLLV